MSLFGTPPKESNVDIASSRQQSKSLFEDEARSTTAQNGSLFADANGNDSPWSIPTPKKAGRSELIRDLIAPKDAPESYIDAFDVILEKGESSNGKISSTDLNELLKSSGISENEQSALMHIVSPGGTPTEGVDRNTFNVLMALVGLAQEGDDVTLDGVDERKKSEDLPYNAMKFD